MYITRPWGKSQRFYCTKCKADFGEEAQVIKHVEGHKEQLPLISCLMVTNKKRKDFIPSALRYFFMQDYPNLELVVVSEDSEVIDLLPDSSRIHFVLTPVNDIGSKRNWGIRCAKGTYIAHWDDDDWQSSRRISAQYDLAKQGYDLVSSQNPLFWDVELSMSAKYLGTRNFYAGSSLFYLRRLAINIPFEPLNLGEDWRFVKAMQNAGVRMRHHENTYNVAYAHENSTSPKHFHTESWETQIFMPEEFNQPHRSEVALVHLTWNNDLNTMKECEAALLAEAERLRKLNITPAIIHVDNGSTKQVNYEGAINLLLEENVGNAVARNKAVQIASEHHFNYMLFTDGDIEVIPFSSIALLSAIRKEPKAACIGLWSGSYSNSRRDVTSELSTVHNIPTYPNEDVAWTQYGLFRTHCLLECPFDSNFGPGWGFEDNDLAFQFLSAGYTIHHIKGAKYLHYIHSSWQHLPNKEALFEQRKRYLLEKWQSDPVITKGVLLSKMAATVLQGK